MQGTVRAAAFWGLALFHSYISAEPFAYVTNQSSNSVSVIDTATNQVVATIPAGQKPAGVAAIPHGRRVYVSNPEGKNISVIDTESRTVIQTVAVGESPLGIAAHPDDTRVYVADWYLNKVFVLDATTLKVAAEIPV